MKKTILVFLLLLPVAKAFSQVNDSLHVSNPAFGKGSKLVDIKDLVKDGFNYWNEDFTGHWAGIGISFNSFAGSDYSMYADEQKNFLDNDLLSSNSLYLNFLQFSKGLQATRNTIGLVTGAGITVQSSRLDKNTTIRKNSEGEVYPETLSLGSNQKSKFSSFYFEVPLLLEFQIPVKNYANRFYFSAGAIAGRRLATYTKIKYREDGQKKKLKTPGSYSVQDYRCSATLRMGYRWINVFATYGLTPFFKKDKGPELFPYSFGIYLLAL